VNQNYQKLSKSTKSLESKMAIFGGNFQFLKNKKNLGKTMDTQVKSVAT